MTYILALRQGFKNRYYKYIKELKRKDEQTGNPGREMGSVKEPT